MSLMLKRRTRWVAGAGAATMIAAGAGGLLWAPTAVAAVSPGQGSAYAQGLQVTPHEGSLAVGATFDEALAGHTDRIARAQSQGLDLGAVGSSMKGYNCGKPPTAADYVPDPLQAETPSSGGQQEATAGPSPKDNNADGSVEHVSANSQPFGEADTTLAGQVVSPGNLISLAGVTTKATSGLVNGVRVATATADVSKVTIAGTVTLSGMHWEADYPSGTGAGQPVSTFHVSDATIAGKEVSSSDLSTLAAAINKALSSLGIEVVFPSATSAKGILSESPLTIQVIPSSTRDGIEDPVVAGTVEPAIYPVANGLENGFSNTSAPYNSLGALETNQIGQQIAAALCQTDTPITVADVTIASFTAGGYFNMSLGGVNASSGELAANPYSLSPFSSFALPGSTQLVGGTAGTPGTPGTPGVAGSAAVAGSPAATGASAGAPSTGSPGAPASSGNQQNASATTPPLARTASGPLLGVGLGVLGLLGLLAALDGHVIRTAGRKQAFQD